MACILAIVLSGFPVPLPAHASGHWESLDTDHFTVRYRTGMEDLGVLTSHLAEDAYARVSTILSHDMSHTVTVYVWPAHQGPDFNGNTSAGDRSIMKSNNCIQVTFPGSVPGFRRSLGHGIAYAFMYDILADERVPVPGIRALGMPGWFAEATALNLAGISPGADDMTGTGILTPGGPGLYSLGGFTGYNSFDSGHQGTALVSYLEATFGSPVIGEIIRDVRDAGTLADALYIQTGKRYPAVLENVAAYLKNNAPRVEDERDADIGMIITGKDPAYNISPSVSPDGKMVACIAAGHGNPVLRIAPLVRTRPDDTGGPSVLPLREFPAGIRGVRPTDNRISWTGSGSTIMLAGRMKGTEAIVCIDAATGAVISAVRLPFSAVMNPVLAPNEDIVAFSGIATVSSDIYLYRRSSGNLTRLTDDEFMDRDPALTPDSTAVIFATNSNETGDLMRDSYDIVKLDIKTGTRELLVRNGYVNIQPSVSPDGTRLVYVSNENGRFDLYIMDLKDRKSARLTGSPSGSFYPTWLPSGDGISYARNNGRGSDVIIRKLASTGTVK